jgi:hypothetical protein
MAHRAVLRCGFPALSGCPVPIFRPAISIHLKQPAFKWNMSVRSLVLSAASLDIAQRRFFSAALAHRRLPCLAEFFRSC